MSDLYEPQWLSAFNKENEPIPPYAACWVVRNAPTLARQEAGEDDENDEPDEDWEEDGSEEDEEADDEAEEAIEDDPTLAESPENALTIRKPSGLFDGPIAFNGPVAIPANGYGQVTLSRVVRALVEGEPANSRDTLGPVADSWALRPGGMGFRSLGADDDGESLLVAHVDQVEVSVRVESEPEIVPGEIDGGPDGRRRYSWWLVIPANDGGWTDHPTGISADYETLPLYEANGRRAPDGAVVRVLFGSSGFASQYSSGGGSPPDYRFWYEGPRDTAGDDADGSGGSGDHGDDCPDGTTSTPVITDVGTCDPDTGMRNAVKKYHVIPSDGSLPYYSDTDPCGSPVPDEGA